MSGTINSGSAANADQLSQLTQLRYLSCRKSTPSQWRDNSINDILAVKTGSIHRHVLNQSINQGSMIFKKTILTLSLCLASGLALAATTEPAPSATPTPTTVEAEQNLAQGAPAYTLTWGESTGSGFMFYPGLSDGVRAHANSAADAEKWGPELGFPIQMHVVDLGGGACVDKFGTCAATAGKGAADMNTVVVYSMQDAASTQEPSDTSVFTERGAVDFTVYGYVGSEAGVSEDEALMHPERWEVIGEVKDNNLVKRTLSFPTKKYAKINVEVSKTAGQTNRNFYGYEVVDPQKEPAIVEIQAFNIPQASPAP